VQVTPLLFLLCDLDDQTALSEPNLWNPWESCKNNKAPWLQKL
jgi:hypothetical protein